MLHFNRVEQGAWNSLVDKYNLTDQTAQKLKEYLVFLLEENKKINLTAITTIKDAIKFHLDDSLMISLLYDFSSVTTLCDIGTGGGLPGIPLKILYPHINVILIEVIQKKVRFLHKVIERLSLQDVQVSDLDWRTFLRTSNEQIDLFCARASLQPEELVRIFKANCPYKKAKLIYWASGAWKPSPKVATYIKDEKIYMILNRKRKYVFF